MLEEFEIASGMGIVCIPVGATGYASRDIWNEISAKPATFYKKHSEVKKHLAVLGDQTKTNEEIVKAVFQIVDLEAAI